MTGLNSRTGRTLQNGNYYHLGPRPGVHSPSLLNGHLGHGPDSPYHTTLSVPLSQGLQPGYDSAQVFIIHLFNTSCTIREELTEYTTITFINIPMKKATDACDNPQVQMLPYQEDWADNTTVTGMSDLMVPTKPLNTGDQVNINTCHQVCHIKFHTKD